MFVVGAGSLQILQRSKRHSMATDSDAAGCIVHCIPMAADDIMMRLEMLITAVQKRV